MNSESISNKVDLSSQKNNRIAPHPIHALEKIRLGGSEQWIRIQGKDTSNPVLLLIQQGPGLPMLNEARDSEKRLNLEEEFVVVYWDQRGCGKSFRSGFPPQSLTLEQMIADTHELIQALTLITQAARKLDPQTSRGEQVGEVAQIPPTPVH